MRHLGLCATTLGIALAGFVNSASAAITTYSDRSSFNAATSGLTTIDFEGLAPDGSFTNYPTPPGLTLSGVNFTIDPSKSDGFLYAIGKDRYYVGTSVLSSQQPQTLTDNNLLITLPGASTEVGMDIGSFFGSTFTFTLSDGTTATVTAPAQPTLGFFGFTSTTPITSISIDEPTTVNPTTAEALNIDNFSFNTVATPEPITGSSLLLIGSGLALIRRPSRARHSRRIG